MKNHSEEHCCLEEKHHEGCCSCGHAHHDHHESCGCCHDQHDHHEGCSCGYAEHDHHEGCSCGHAEHDHHEGCGCGHDHGNDDAAGKELPRLLAAFALFLCGLLLPVSAVLRTALFLACYAVSGYDVLLSAVKSLVHGRMLSEHFLMTVASLAAMAIGEMTEGCAVMLFYQAGECCQSFAVGRSRKRVKSLLELKVEEAYAERDGVFVSVNPAEVRVGEVIRVRPGERVPLDAVVLSGMSDMDTSALTGESVPQSVQPGDSVLAGFVAQNGVITARVAKPLEESSVSRIMRLVEEAQDRKAPAERFITAFARIYTPVVVGLAVLLAVVPPVFLGGFRTWIYRALTFLVASCPCALVISVPLCYFAGIGSAARSGILIKGGDSLDALCRVKTFVLDKTGTLTTGDFAVRHVHPANGYTEKELLGLIAGAEKDSRHPLAAAAVCAAKEQGVLPADIDLQEEIAGRGVRGKNAEGKTVLAGNVQLLEENDIEIAGHACHADGARIYAACGGVYAGMICLSDVIKTGAKEAVSQMRGLGVDEMVMLTGDREAPAKAAAEELGLDGVHAQLLPADKLKKLDEICKKGGAAFVGDGINDAPALMRADVGVAMGALGSDAAIEAADVVLMTDELQRLPDVLRIARRVRRLAAQNVWIALGVKIAVLALAAFGIAGMWAAVFADVGVALICVINAMRAMRSA